MSHTTFLDGTDTVVVHDGDPSPASVVEVRWGELHPDFTEINSRVRYGDIREFVGLMLRDAKIAQLEQMTGLEFLQEVTGL